MTIAQEFIKFVNKSPSPFHAVEECRQRLIHAGYKELKEREAWKDVIQPMGKYFFTRNQSSIVAFAIGGNYVNGNGFAIIGAHTDSPCLKLKPISKKEKLGYVQVGVQTYGGGIWPTWFDRDLGVAGRVMVRQGNNYAHRLVNVNRPLLRIPMLAIHLDRTVNDGFKFNKETNLNAILGLKDPNAAADDGAHHSGLLEVLGKNMHVDPKDICDMEMCLYDIQPATLGGLNDEFVYSARLDNLAMSFCALQGLLSGTDTELKTEDRVHMVALFDNEEVGSNSAYGAASTMLSSVMQRIQNSADMDTFHKSIAQSYFLSADMAHAVHPNHSDKHEDNHRPVMNKGVVLKHNANQRYATTAPTAFILHEIAKQNGVPLQEFVIRQDLACGSTIGPIVSTGLGMQTIDVGIPQLAMHSIREMCGSSDIASATKLFKAFFTHFSTTQAKMVVD